MEAGQTPDAERRRRRNIGIVVGVAGLLLGLVLGAAAGSETKTTTETVVETHTQVKRVPVIHTRTVTKVRRIVRTHTVTVEVSPAGGSGGYDSGSGGGGSSYAGMNCSEIGHSFTVTPGSDPEHDADNDGVACESYG